MSYPAINASAVIADKKPTLIYRFDKMQIIGSLHTNQYNVADFKRARITRFQRHEVSIIDPSFHGMSSRSDLRRAALRQCLFCKLRPTHIRVMLAPLFNQQPVVTLRLDAERSDSAGPGTALVER